MVTTTSLGRSVALGLATGIRSTYPFAGISRSASAGALSLPENRAIGLLARPRVAMLLTALAAIEMVGDKLPFTPKRTTVGPLLQRMAFGAGAAGVVAGGNGESVAVSAGAGAISAVWSAFAATSGRETLAERGVPSFVTGVVEDALAVALVFGVLTGRRSRIV